MDALEAFKARRLLNLMKVESDCGCDDIPTVAAIEEDIYLHGLAVPYDVPTGDGRMVARDALHWDLEATGIPIIWDRDDGDHSGMTLGKVDSLRADDAGVWVEARLFKTEDPVAAAAVARVVELIAEKSLGWSVMLDDEEVEVRYKDPEVVETKDGTIIRYATRDTMQMITSAGVRHLAIVDTPAFIGAFPQLGREPINAAAVAVATFTKAHFERWESVKAVPLQVTADGRVWGHAAGDGCGRWVGRACTKYNPDPDPKMRNFHTGTATLDDGSVIRVGALTAMGLHASTRGSLADQRHHHENSTTVWAKVVAWNDAYGRLCVAGSVVPGLDSAQVAQVAGLPISVELWPVPGFSAQTLVGAHTVVTPAWPVV